MFSLSINDSAENDLDDLYKKDKDAWSIVTVLLETIKEDQEILDLLTVHNHANDIFGISKWLSQHAKKNNLWRLKAFEPEGWGIRYRILYAFDPSQHHYYVLGVLSRDICYDESNERVQRVIREYADLDIPVY